MVQDPLTNPPTPGKDALQEVSGAILHWIVSLLSGVDVLRKPLTGDLTGAHVVAVGVLLGGVLCMHGVLIGFLKKRRKAAAVSAGPDAGTSARKPSTAWGPLVADAVSRPAYLLLWVYGLYFALAPLLLFLPSAAQGHPVARFCNAAFNLGVFVSICWFFFRLTRVFEARLSLWARDSKNQLDDLVVQLVGRCLRVLIPVLAVIFALPLIGLPPEYDAVVRKGIGLLVIAALAWIAFQVAEQVEIYILAKFDVNASDNLQARKVHTQVQVLKKTAYFVVGVVTVASAMMMFEDVRRLGTSILASAGVLGIIIGFAAQRSIANLFAGLQLALAQPIRLDDVVIVEGEWGRIEEVTLTYVVVRIWDLRRLVVPLSHFIEKPFQNWTRNSADILGTVFLFADYTVPVEEVRKELHRLVELSPHWDKKTCVLQVTNATDRALELRALASAGDASKAWDLRCEIREKLITFLQKNYPDSLPRTRAVLEGGASGLAAPANRDA
jgi:small-conductance mechanosensitive channel